jgi:serine/threonine-protein kinase
VTAVDSPLARALAARYTLERELGRGGMATVYLAHDLRHDRLVALKVLHPELAHALGPERFLQEIRTTARLEHPHILPVFDSGEAAGLLWYTMPYVEGESLRARLTREGQLPVEDALRLAREVAEALDCAHDNGIVHRDIKPENILLARGHARVADFGVARALEAAGGGGLTEAGMAVGTPVYMSPEQASGGQVDARSDVYALGCVLYETLAGEPPFTGPTPQAVLARRFTETPRLLHTVRETVPSDVEAAVAKALARVPADRFQSAAEFARALTAHPTPVAGVATTSPPASPPSPAHLNRPPGPARPSVPTTVVALTIGFLVGLGVLFAWRRSHPGSEAAGEKVLAVLPLKNLGAAEDDYFADGLTEEITSRLAGVSGLAVISRTSADQYRKTNKSLREIGHELGAGYIVEGSIRWERVPGGRSRIRVTPQLIRIADDRHLWADRYDAELADVFQVQAEIAEKVTKALDVALVERERQMLASKPTENLEAYTFYLRGNDYYNRSQLEDDFRNAARMYRQAADLDPQFAVTRAKLSIAYSALYWHYFDRSDERLAQAKAAADEALRLAPALPEAHLALGYYFYWGKRDYDRALEEFGIALRSQPNNSDLLSAIGYVKRRQGRLDESIRYLRRSTDLDPRANVLWYNLGQSYVLMREYAEAEQCFSRASALGPDWAAPSIENALVFWLKDGDTAGARGFLRDALGRLGMSSFASDLVPVGYASNTALVARDEEIRTRLQGLPLDAFNADTANYFALKSELHRLGGDPRLARVYADSARLAWELKVRQRPSEGPFHSGLAMAYAGLGRKNDAVRESRTAIELLPVSKDAWLGSEMVLAQARVLTLVGDQDAAVDRLKDLLSVPSRLSPALLRVDPTWDPLRGNPRFRQLVGER